MAKPVLEPAAQALLEAIADGRKPHLFRLGPIEGRKALDQAQSPEIEVPGTGREVLVDPAVTVFRPTGVTGALPVILYLHGGGWVFGNDHTHDRLTRTLALGTGAAVVFVRYSLSPEARYPGAIGEIYAAARWVVTNGAEHGLDPSRIAVAGDSVGGNMAAALTLTAKQRGGLRLAGQVLFYPVTDAAFETGSYREFAEGYPLRRDAMQWFWDQYTTDAAQRDEITASPLRATLSQLAGLPPALVITAEADVLRDEGEAYAGRLRKAGVPVTAVRYQGITHDFVGLNALRETRAARGAVSQAIAFLTEVLHPHGNV